jgi:hypothetical protein
MPLASAPDYFDEDDRRWQVLSRNPEQGARNRDHAQIFETRISDCTHRLRRGFECAARETYPCLLIWHGIRYTVFVITIGERSETLPVLRRSETLPVLRNRVLMQIE